MRFCFFLLLYLQELIEKPGPLFFFCDLLVNQVGPLFEKIRNASLCFLGVCFGLSFTLCLFCQCLGSL